MWMRGCKEMVWEVWVKAIATELQHDDEGSTFVFHFYNWQYNFDLALMMCRNLLYCSKAPKGLFILFLIHI